MDVTLHEPALVGRARETATLLHASERVHQDRAPAVVLVTGEAGSGKTRLMREVAATLVRDGWHSARGHALPGQGLPPYYAFTRVMRQIAREADATHPPTATLLPILAEAGLASDDFAAEPGHVDSGAGRLRLIEAMAQLLDEAATSAPLIVTLDDMQWAGRGDWEVIEHAARFGQQPILFVIGARSPDIWEAHSPAERTLRELSRHRLLTQVELSPLDPGATRELAASLLAGPVSDALAEVVFARAGGNAFFVEELIAHLASRDRILLSGEMWDFAGDGLPEAIPPTVELAVRDRLLAMPRGTRSLLEVAAVAGRQVESATLAKAVGQPVLRVVETLNPAVTAGLMLDVGSGWSFRHDLVREAILQSVSDQATIHAAIAGALALRAGVSQDHASFSALANHWLLAGRPREAAEAAIDASLRASRAYAPQEALELARAGYEAATGVDGNERYELECRSLSRLGNAARDVGDYAAAGRTFSTLQQLAEANDDSPRVGIALIRLADLARRRERPEEAARAYRQGIAILEAEATEPNELATALIQYTWLCGLTLADYAAAEAAGVRALELARQLRDPAMESEVTIALASANTRAHGPRESRRALEEALDRAAALRQPALAAEVAASLANDYYWSGELRRSRHFAERRLAYAEAAHDLFGLRHGHSWLALVACSEGEFDEAARLLAMAEPLLARLDSPEPLAFVRIVSGLLEFQLGNVEQAHGLLREGFNALKPLGDGTLVWYGGLLVLTCLEAGRDQEAMEELAAQEARVAALPSDALPARSARCALGMAYARLGNLEKARACEDALASFAGDFHWWPARRTLAVLCELRGDQSAALTHLDAAIATAREENQRPDLAAMLLHRATLLPIGSSARHAALVESRQLATSLGMRALLQALAPEMGRPAEARPFGLTSREREVLVLLSAGNTNREIAEALVISERTVVNHLSHIFAKLNVENRASATALAIRSGLA